MLCFRLHFTATTPDASLSQDDILLVEYMNSNYYLGLYLGDGQLQYCNRPIAKSASSKYDNQALKLNKKDIQNIERKYIVGFLKGAGIIHNMINVPSKQADNLCLLVDKAIDLWKSLDQTPESD